MLWRTDRTCAAVDHARSTHRICKPGNGKPRSGYKVIFVAFANGRPVGAPEDVLTGFVNAEGDALGRPVGVAVDRAGALLVADDVGNVIWRVKPAASKQ